MIPAAARTSGTTWPAASVLNRGVIASSSACRLRSRACSRARTEARARTRRLLRAYDVFAEYADLLWALEPRCAGACRRGAASAGTAEADRHGATPSSVEKTLTN